MGKTLRGQVASRTAPELQLTLMCGCTNVMELYHYDEAEVTVKFDFTPGYPDRIRADPNDSEEGCPDCAEIVRITADECMEFSSMDENYTLYVSKGTDITHLFTRNQLQALEETLVMEPA